MQMNEGMDTGDVLLVSETDILSNETTAELWDRLSILGSELLIKTLENLHTIPPTPQIHEEASYAPLISKSIGRIDWNLSANEIHNLIRGCVSWPVAHCEFRGKVMKVWQSTVLDINSHDIPTGTIIQTKPLPVVSTGLGALELKEIQLPGKKRCDASALTNGFQITIGESLEFSTTEVL